MKGLYKEEITDVNEIEKIKAVANLIKPEFKKNGNIHIERFHEDGGGADRAYNVYKIKLDSCTYVLKKSDKNEIEVYEKFLSGKDLPVPKLEGWTCVDDIKWILMEYIEGADLRAFNKSMTYGCADSLADIFNMYWKQDNFEENKLDSRFERYWTRINKRSECLINEPKLAAAYRTFLDRQLVCPRTLCNGDFLQYNAIDSDSGIILIDWAFAGIMPYSLDIARLITHGSEKYSPFPFYMTKEYREIFLKKLYGKMNYKPDYRQVVWDVILSALNECIEFIESELKDETIERDEVFKYYYEKANELTEVILKGKEKLSI